MTLFTLSRKRGNKIRKSDGSHSDGFPISSRRLGRPTSSSHQNDRKQTWTAPQHFTCKTLDTGNKLLKVLKAHRQGVGVVGTGEWLIGQHPHFDDRVTAPRPEHLSSLKLEQSIKDGVTSPTPSIHVRSEENIRSSTVLSRTMSHLFKGKRERKRKSVKNVFDGDQSRGLEVPPVRGEEFSPRFDIKVAQNIKGKKQNDLISNRPSSRHLRLVSQPADFMSRAERRSLETGVSSKHPFAGQQARSPSPAPSVVPRPRPQSMVVTSSIATCEPVVEHTEAIDIRHARRNAFPTLPKLILQFGKRPESFPTNEKDLTKGCVSDTNIRVRKDSSTTEKSFRTAVCEIEENENEDGKMISLRADRSSLSSKTSEATIHPLTPLHTNFRHQQDHSHQERCSLDEDFSGADVSSATVSQYLSSPSSSSSSSSFHPTSSPPVPESGKEESKGGYAPSLAFYQAPESFFEFDETLDSIYYGDTSTDGSAVLATSFSTNDSLDTTASSACSEGDFEICRCWRQPVFSRLGASLRNDSIDAMCQSQSDRNDAEEISGKSNLEKSIGFHRPIRRKISLPPSLLRVEEEDQQEHGQVYSQPRRSIDTALLQSRYGRS